MSETTVRWRLNGRPLVTYDSRISAEKAAAHFDATVQRVTTIVEDVGLRWVCVGHAWQLWDGPKGPTTGTTTRRLLAHIPTDWDGEYLLIGCAYNDGMPQVFATLDEAKAAAEAAVKATWS